jgi:hypothetical protein
VFFSQKKRPYTHRDERNAHNNKKKGTKKEKRENLKRNINNGLVLFSCQIHRTSRDKQIEISKEKKNTL